MKMFVKKEGAVVYNVNIKDVLRFELAMDYVGIGMSFRQLRRPSRGPKIVRRRRSWLESMMESSASTRAS
jgi:hypothetical protein